MYSRKMFDPVKAKLFNPFRAVTDKKKYTKVINFYLNPSNQCVIRLVIGSDQDLSALPRGPKRMRKKFDRNLLFN